LLKKWHLLGGMLAQFPFMAILFTALYTLVRSVTPLFGEILLDQFVTKHTARIVITLYLCKRFPKSFLF